MYANCYFCTFYLAYCLQKKSIANNKPRPHMLNAKGVLLHTTYNLLKASFWLVCSLEQGNVNKRSGNQTKTRLKVLWSKSSSKYPSKKIRPKIPQKFLTVKKFLNNLSKNSSKRFVQKFLHEFMKKKICQKSLPKKFVQIFLKILCQTVQ